MYLFTRLRYSFKATPVRILRLFRHLGVICPWKVNWWTDLAFYLLDLIFFFDLYEILSNLLALRTRQLTEEERAVLKSIFGNSLAYDLVRIDERARIGPPQYELCYVSFFTINSWGKMSAVTLVHEAVHVWQYLRVGAVYIPRALRAQRTRMGYNYGGLDQIKAYPELHFYNYEQQADIVADAFALREGYPARWAGSRASWVEHWEVFAPFLEVVRAEGTEEARG